ncbi:MAG: hypothetical protein PF487_11310 [Bacteroidales bacterium]|jgi:hypothetical protein|nr:hypothetical protein [Bacteroidales bacterium]
MRKIFFILLSSTGLSNIGLSQINSVGGGLILSTGAEYELSGLKYYNNSKALDLRFTYDIKKKKSVVTKINLFYPNEEDLAFNDEFSRTTLFIVASDFHYTPKLKNMLRVYYLGGPTVMLWKIKDQHYSSTFDKTYDINEFKFSFGLNVGGGINFDINNSYKMFLETKYIISKNSQLLFTAGISYSL